ncbi:uncharacterized protein DS421_4g119610 [Arachis hypogaea]|nr:uncharacterized protein DS421_4g119610 [Arachis hypogaea]
MKEETPLRCHHRSFVAVAVDRRKSKIRESCEGRASPEESSPLPLPLFVAPSPLACAIASRERETRAVRELPPWRSRRVLRRERLCRARSAAVAGKSTAGKGFKLGSYSFGFREPLSSLHVYFSYPPPLLVVLNCRTVVAAVRVTGNMAVITGTTIGVTIISVQSFALVWHQGAALSPELLLLRFLNYSIELRRCLEAVAAAGTVDINAVAVG